MNDNYLMEKNEFSFPAIEENMPTENINNKNHTQKLSVRNSCSYQMMN